MSVATLNYDLTKISERVYKWKMTFNLDSNKQDLDVIFSRRTYKTNHRELAFNGDNVFVAKKP